MANRLLRAVAAALPTGATLSPDSWQRRHDWICRLLWLHALLLPFYGLARGEAAEHVLLESGGLAGLALLARSERLSASARATVATVGCIAASAILVHLSGGVIEMHFHYFVMVAVVSLYQTWQPFLVALSGVVLRHGVFGVLSPEVVYNHPAAIARPWSWALLHGAFILAQSVVCVIVWRLNEDAVTRERDVQGELTRVSDALAAAQRLASVGSWEWHVASDTIAWSDEQHRIFGTDRSSVALSRDTFLEFVHPDDRERVGALIHTAVVTSTRLDYQCRIVRRDGSVREIHSLGSVEVTDGVPVRLIGTCQDITERRALEAEIEYRAFYDTLTGLANRALFLDRLEHALVVGERSGTATTVLYLDLDDFKAVNDTLGHDAGDDLLIAIALRLKAVVRDSDTVARFGGDEFAVLLERTDLAEAEITAERMLAALLTPVTIGDRRRKVGASIGIAGTNHATDAEQLLQHADLAMYAAKSRAAGSAAVFHPGLAATALSRATRELELADAIAFGQLELHFQPIVALATGHLDSVEALVRWRHAELGLLAPSEFIPVAEETGQIVALGAWVTHEATAQAAELRDATGQPVKVTVNVSAKQLDTDVVAMVAAALARSGLPPECLTLEITETFLASHQDGAVAKLEALRGLGVRIAIDDFGTGYSSLEYLKQLPIDTLKIDRAFIRSVTDGVEGSALAHAIIKLADTFGLRTIAEGIETEEQAEVVRGFGCGFGQGSLYARPVPIEDLLATFTCVRRRDAVTAARPGPAPEGQVTREDVRAG